MPKLSMIEAAKVEKVKQKDIQFLVKELTKRHDEGLDAGFETQCFILLHYYSNKKRKSEKMFATVERMRCLGDLMKDERMRGWTMSTKEPGCLLTHEAVFAATATCPLRDNDEKFWFDPGEFFDLVLKATKPESRT